MNTTNPVLENFYSLLKIPHGCFWQTLRDSADRMPCQ
nr:MAG TPA: hypothetical protein [Caudoviricetes sp.]